MYVSVCVSVFVCLHPMTACMCWNSGSESMCFCFGVIECPPLVAFLRMLVYLCHVCVCSLLLLLCFVDFGGFLMGVVFKHNGVFMHDTKQRNQNNTCI